MSSKELGRWAAFFAALLFYLDWKNRMINALGIWNNWLSLSSQAAMLPLRTQSVIALRLIRIAGGDLARSEAEATRMGTEKVQALGEAQLVVPVEPMTGRNPRRIAKKSMAKAATAASRRNHRWHTATAVTSRRKS